MHIWNLETETEEFVLKEHVPIGDKVTFGLNGQVLAVSNDQASHVHLWSVEEIIAGTQIEKSKLYLPDAWAMTFSNDGILLATWGKHNIQLRDIKTNKEFGSLPVPGFSSGSDKLAFSADGELLASANCKKDTQIQIWRVATGEELNSLQMSKTRVDSLAFHPNKKLLAIGHKEIVLWDIETGKNHAVLQIDADHAGSLIFNSDGKFLAARVSLNFLPDIEQEVWLWNIETRTEPIIFKEHHGSVSSITFTSDGKSLIYTSRYSIIQYNVETKEKPILRDLKPFKIILEHDPDTEEPFSPFKLIDTVKEFIGSTVHKRLKPGVHTITGYQNVGEAYSVALSPDNTILAVGHDNGELQLWNLKTGQEIVKLTNHNAGINNLAFNSDGTLLVTTSLYDGTIRLWGLLRHS